MSGANGEPGESAKDIYCNAQAENYPTGTTNLTIIKKLFPIHNSKHLYINIYKLLVGRNIPSDYVFNEIH
jgi:hypothetical protein